jgi:hypothetical protein
MDDPVRLTTVPGEAEAESLCGLLRSEGIECGHRETPEDDSPFEGIATDGIREILVHPKRSRAGARADRAGSELRLRAPD